MSAGRETLARVAAAYGHVLVDARPVGGGHIHGSFLLEVADGPPLFLQQVNTRVYPDPAALMENVTRICAHLAAVPAPASSEASEASEASAASEASSASAAPGGADDPRRRGLVLHAAPDGGPLHRDPETGTAWRLFDAVTGTRVEEHVRTPAEARRAAAAFGAFFARLNTPAGGVTLTLHETIPRFHDTPHRFEQLDAAVDAAADDPALAARLAGCAGELAALAARRADAGRLVALQAAGALPPRCVHNDPKPSNLLLDAETGEPLCVVDLDNAMPGTSLHDFGDMVRAMASPTEEDTRDLEAIDARPELFEALVDGWLATAGRLLEPAELDHLWTAGWTITLEQAVRFLADHLLGDVTYRTARPDHNLERCRTQRRLVERLEARRDELEAAVARQRRAHGLEATAGSD